MPVGTRSVVMCRHLVNTPISLFWVGNLSSWIGRLDRGDIRWRDLRQAVRLITAAVRLDWL